MTTFSREQQKMVLAGLVAAIIAINVYFFLTGEKPKTAPLTYERGAVAQTSVRQGLAARSSSADPLSVFMLRRDERFFGASRDIFRMENPVVRPKSKPTPTVAPPQLPAVPERSPEEIAADLARVDLGKFRFLGYLTDKDNTLFLSKDGELFIVKSGDKLLQSYRVKEAGRDFVVLLDTITKVEVRIDLSGSEQAPQQQPQPPQRGR